MFFQKIRKFSPKKKTPMKKFVGKKKKTKERGLFYFSISKK